MRKSAATWFDGVFDTCKREHKESDKELLQDLKDKFIKRFDKANEWLQEHLVQFVVHKPGQSVQAYYSALIERTKKLGKSDKELKGMFLTNLRSEYKMFVLSRKPESLDRSYVLAREAESLITIAEVTSGSESISSWNLPGELQVRGKQTVDPAGMANLASNVQRESRSTQID